MNVLPQTTDLRIPNDLRVNNPVSESTWSLLAGLRFVLASIVVIGHENLYLPSDWVTASAWLHNFGGFQSVEAFFVISGFSIASSIERDRHNFVDRRIWRIIPVYVACFALSVIPFGIFGPVITTAGSSFESPTGRMGELGFVLNGLCLQGFLTVPISTFGQSWSLGCEVWYYALAPLLVRLSNKVIAVIALGSFILYMIQSTWFPWFNNAKLYAVPLITLFCIWLVGFLYYRFRDNKVGNFWLPYLLAALAVVATGNCAPWGAVTMLVLGLIFVHGRTIELSVVMRSRLNLLGNLSYPLYLSHMIVIAVAGHMIHSCPVVGGWVIYGLAVVVSAAVYFGVDVPIHVWRKSVSPIPAQRSPSLTAP